GRFLNHDEDDVPFLDETAKGKMQVPPAAQPHLVYASFVERLQVWIVQGNQSRSITIPLAQTDLLRMVRDFNRTCKDPKSPTAEVEKQATALYQQLVQPVIAALSPADTVAIEFDQAIPPFAFEALRSPEGRYFGADYAVFRSPGLFAEGALRQPAPLKPQ